MKNTYFLDAALLLLLGMKISSSSSLFSNHNKGFCAAIRHEASLLYFCFFHRRFNLISSCRISSGVLDGHPLLLNALPTSVRRVSLLRSSSNGTVLLSTVISRVHHRSSRDIVERKLRSNGKLDIFVNLVG